MTLEEKIASAVRLIRRVKEEFKSPVVMSSFGKDSMVMLDLIEREGLRFPILFHREPFFPAKYNFANRIIEERGYSVYDYPPLTTSVVKNNGHMEVVNFYSIGKSQCYVPTGIREPQDGQPFLCGYKDLYQKPLGTMLLPWDVCFIGHKSSDRDPILGAVPLLIDVKLNEGSMNYAFPLRHFTDEDIWQYHDRFSVPFEERRYDRGNGYKEFPDITFNPDYHYACTRCIDRDQPPAVFCPKLGYTIANISAQVRYIEPEKPAYIGGANV